MIQQNNAKIFLAENRDVTNLSWLKSCCTFNKDAWESDSSLASFLMLNDDVLVAGKILELIAQEDADIILLPIAGTIIYNDSCGNSAFIEAGKLQSFPVKQYAKIEIINPYKKELVNFLHVWLKPGSVHAFAATTFSFEPEINKNRLIALFDDANETGLRAKFLIGKFNGRSEALHKVSKPGNALFVFVIEGAFEVRYRLLETRDALALWNIEEAGIEALSNDAVLLLVELKGSKAI